MTSIKRRQFLQNSLAASGLLAAPAIWTGRSAFGQNGQRRPNILFAISDDQSWLHTSAYRSPFVVTPAFDHVANMGCLFSNAFCAAPQCSPNRASILTGRHIWQNREAGTHASYFPRDLTVFPNLLEESGYFIGYTGKPWGPGNWQDSGWPRNPAGNPFNEHRYEETPHDHMSRNNYSANFKDFLEERPDDQPFFFWYGAYEPHRAYEKGIGLQSGKTLDQVDVPEFLPDEETVRSDLLDYSVEIEWFDHHLEVMLDQLEAAGELENTLIIVTSDNGMPFPRAKANLYEYGIHEPLAVSWPAGFDSARRVHDLISFTDFAPTILEAAGITPPESMTGSSFLDVLTSNESGLVDADRTRIFSGRERHSHSRYDNLGYPCRAIRTQEYLYIRNLKPDRWPAGDPPNYHDVDGCPTKTFLLENKEDPRYREYFEWSFGKRPEEELYDVRQDPSCLVNLAGDASHAGRCQALWQELRTTLTAQGDPRMEDNPVFDSYPRFNRMRPQLGGFAERGEYNPKYAPDQ